MCGTKRPSQSLSSTEQDDSSSNKSKTQRTLQATLFGGVGAKKNPVEVATKKRKVGTSGTSSAAPPNAPVGQVPPVKKPMPASLNSTSLSLPRPAEATRQGTLSFGQGIHSSKEWQGLCCPRVANTSQMDIPALKERIKRALRVVFGVKRLRLLQPAAVQCALKGQSQLLVMATGGGKSLCYQLPAVVMGGTCIVISPLIALMQDQVSALLKKHVQAAVLSSASGERQNKQTVERLLGRHLGAPTKNAKDPSLQHITLLYVTPEQVKTKRFRDVLAEMHKQGKLSLFAVDEAHWCVCRICSHLPLAKPLLLTHIMLLLSPACPVGAMTLENHIYSWIISELRFRRCLFWHAQPRLRPRLLPTSRRSCISRNVRVILAPLIDRIYSTRSSIKIY
jgi:DEAD/DEAH box helicase